MCGWASALQNGPPQRLPRAYGTSADAQQKLIRPFDLLLRPGGDRPGIIERRLGRLDRIAAVLSEPSGVSRGMPRLDG